MEIKRGYVKWTDKYGVFHKEPLYNMPEMYENASDDERALADELRIFNNEPEEELTLFDLED